MLAARQGALNTLSNRVRARSTTPSSGTARQTGSRVRPSAERGAINRPMAANPIAPAAAIKSMRSSVIPPIARTGASEALTMDRRPSAPRGGCPAGLDAVVNTANQDPGGRQPARRPHRNRVAAQVHTVSAARERDVQSIVDDDAGRGAARDGEHVVDEPRQLRGVEIALADLNEVHARARRMTRLGQEAAA